MTHCAVCDLTTVCVSDWSHRKRSDQAGSVSSHLRSLPVGVIRASSCGQTEGTSGSSCGPERRVQHPKRSDRGLDLHLCSCSKSVGLSLKSSKSYAADTKRAGLTKSMWTVFLSDMFTYSRATSVQRLHRQIAGTTESFWLNTVTVKSFTALKKTRRNDSFVFFCFLLQNQLHS